MVGSIIVSFSLSFVLSFSPLVITVCHLPNKIFCVTLLIQALRGMNKTLKYFSVSKFSILPIKWFISETPEVHIRLHTLHLLYEIFPFAFRAHTVFCSVFFTVWVAQRCPMSRQCFRSRTAMPTITPALLQCTAFLYLNSQWGLSAANNLPGRKKSWEEPDWLLIG